MLQEVHLMSRSRSIQDKSKTGLKEVRPYNTLFISPMPCENKCAAIRNKTVASMRQNDIGDVAYRYLQTRRGQNNTLKEVIFWGSMSTIMLGLFRGSSRSVRLLSALPSALHVPPNIGNTIRYSETKRSSEEWLSSRLDKNKIKEIKAMKFNQAGMLSLNIFLKRENIDNSSVENRTKTKDTSFSCWDMDR